MSAWAGVPERRSLHTTRKSVPFQATAGESWVFAAVEMRMPVASSTLPEELTRAP